MAEKDEYILQIENVGKEYILGTVTGDTLKDAIKAKLSGKTDEVHNKRFVALQDINLKIKAGETIGIIGSNGAGKSTLLKLISRITAPSTGKITISGRVASMLEVGTGFHPELTGRENIYLNGSILGMTRAEIASKIDSIIEFSEVGSFIDTPVKRYSSGMYVKLAFSVAAHLDSEIMIMDEVLAVGDVKFQHKCLNKMKEIAEREGRTILYVSHNLDTVDRLCKRCIVLDHGHMVYDGNVEEAKRIYMGNDLRKENYMDLSKYVRPGWLTRDDVQFTWAEYPDQSSGIVRNGKLKLLLRWKNNQDVANMGLRVEFMDDEERPFTVSTAYNFYSGKAGEEAERLIEVDLSGVKNGKYQTFYTLFLIDPYKENVDIDCVRGLYISIEADVSDDLMKWRNTSWGNMELPGITFLE